jgi:hypothetical protein
MGRVTTVGSSVRFRYCGLLPADVTSPQGPPLCAPPVCGPSPRLSRHDLIVASCWGVIRPPTCFCASWWSCWIFCCFSCGVREESLHTASIWLCVFSSICLRCCIADCETPACCQQGCLCVGVVPPHSCHGDLPVCQTQSQEKSCREKMLVGSRIGGGRAPLRITVKNLEAEKPTARRSTPDGVYTGRAF